MSKPIPTGTTEITTEESPLSIIQMAVQSNADPQTLEKLMDLQDRYEANQSRKAYTQAMVSAQSEMPTIYKSRQNAGTRSSYASFDDIMRVVRPVLDKNGLAVSFSQVETGENITVTCNILHIGGHSEATPFTLPKGEAIKSASGKSVTNAAQVMGSANSYAKRYCLANALNIVLGDQDDDAKAQDTPIQLVTTEQADELKQLCGDAGIEYEKFLHHFKAESFETVPKVFYGKAKSTLKERLATNAKNA